MIQAGVRYQITDPFIWFTIYSHIQSFDPHLSNISKREDKRGVYCHPVTRNNMLPPGNYYPVISDYLAQHWHITRKCDPRQPVIRWTISQLMSYLITTASLALLVIATFLLSWMTFNRFHWSLLSPDVCSRHQPFSGLHLIWAIKGLINVIKIIQTIFPLHDKSPTNNARNVKCLCISVWRCDLVRLGISFELLHQHFWN